MNTNQNVKNKDKKNKARKTFNIISSVVVALLFVFLLFALVVIVWGKVSGNDKPIFGYYLYDVVTGSMEPTIMTGDVILCKKVENVNNLKKYDVITFIAPSGQAAGHNVTHRIVDVVYNVDGVTVKYFLTKGDAKPQDEWQLNPNNVKAELVKVLPTLGKLRRFLLTPQGYIVLIFVPMLIVGILFIASFIKEKTKRIVETENAENVVKLDDLSQEEKNKLLSEFSAKLDINDRNLDNTKNFDGEIKTDKLCDNEKKIEIELTEKMKNIENFASVENSQSEENLEIQQISDDDEKIEKVKNEKRFENKENNVEIKKN